LFRTGSAVTICSVSEDKRGLNRISIDWWATIVAGVIVAIAVAGLLPKIPW
jgi:hypothetical protein